MEASVQDHPETSPPSGTDGNSSEGWEGDDAGGSVRELVSCETGTSGTLSGFDRFLLLKLMLTELLEIPA